MIQSTLHRELRKWTQVARIIAATARSRLRFALGDISSTSGSTHSGRRVEESLHYIRRVFDDYLYFGGLHPACIADKDFLELGPGDNLGVALLFLAHGARSVTCLDKFESVSDPKRERLIYLALRGLLEPRERARFDEAVQLDPLVQWNPGRIERIAGAAQDAAAVLNGRRFDVILSRAVLEEIADTDRAFDAMAALLRPGGRLLHKIDLSDYGTFSGAGLHPLEFLTIPHWIYRWMSDDNGRPNRRSVSYYREKMKSLGFHADIYITEVLEPGSGYRPVNGKRTRLEEGTDYTQEHIGLLAQIRPRLAAPFRDLEDEDLLAAGIFLSAESHPRAN